MADFLKDVAPTLGGFIGTIGNLFGIGSANAQNAENIERQNQLNVEQWMRENNYNLPINQVQRLREAGLSPSLMYKNGVSGLTAAASPEMQAAHANPLQVDPLTLAQVEKLGAETEAIQDANDRENQKQVDVVEQIREAVNLLKSERAERDALARLHDNLSDESFNRSQNLFYEWNYLMRTFEDRVNITSNDASISGTNKKYFDESLRKSIALMQTQIDILKKNAETERMRARTEKFRSETERWHEQNVQWDMGFQHTHWMNLDKLQHWQNRIYAFDAQTNRIIGQQQVDVNRSRSIISSIFDAGLSLFGYQSGIVGGFKSAFGSSRPIGFKF